MSTQGNSWTRWAVVGALGVAAALVGTILHPKGQPSCHGEPMRAGDWCETVSSPDTVDTTDHAQMLAQQSVVPTIAIVAGALLIMLVMVVRLRHRAQSSV